MTDIDVNQSIPPLSADHRSELESLLQPIREDLPAGPPIRFDPVFTAIRLAREEDDPNLPMGVWERPLKRADWAQIEARCKVTLSRHAKDLQIAAWLAEALARQHGVEGLLRGLLLLEGLLVRFWEDVHPQVGEDGDADARVAPLEWMNQSLAVTIRIHIPVLRESSDQVGQFSLADWDRMSRDALSPAGKENARRASEQDESRRTCADLIDHAKTHRRADAERSLQQVRHCIAAVLSIASVTEARLGTDAPDMSKLRDTLRAVERVLLQLGATGETGIASRDATLAPLGAVTDEAGQVEAQPGEAQTAKAATGEALPTDAAELLNRRIGAICKAAGIHAPSNAERLMAMQIGLLHDQNVIMQSAMKAAAGQIGTQASDAAASSDFTALVAVLLARTTTGR